MKKQNLRSALLAMIVITLSVASALPQKPRPRPIVKAPRSIIFAVLNDGRALEPIAYINKGKLEAPVDGGDDANIIAAFNKTYYKPGTVYRLIFGSANAGTVTVKSSNAKGDCAKNMADVVTRAGKTPMKGLVMGCDKRSGQIDACRYQAKTDRGGKGRDRRPGPGRICKTKTHAKGIAVPKPDWP